MSVLDMKAERNMLGDLTKKAKADAVGQVMVDAIIHGLGGNTETGRCQCPACPPYKSPSLSVSLGGNGRPVIHCHRGCPQDAVIEALQRLGLWRVKDAEKVVERRERERSTSRPTPKVPKFDSKDKAIEALEACTARGRSVQDEADYLLLRGITVHPDNVWLLDVPTTRKIFNVSGHAMVARIKHKDGTPAAHVTFLDREARKKFDDDDYPIRKSLGPIKGGYVALAPAEPDRPLIVGEGIETTLSAMQLTGFPGIAALNAGNMKVIDPPEASSYIIAADNDTNEVGQKAAKALAERLRAQGRHVHVAVPGEPDSDWNDSLRECKGKDDAAELAAQLFPPDAQTDRGNASVSGKASVILPEAEPMKWAEGFIEEHWAQGETTTLAYYRDTWYCWVGTHYRQVAEIRIEKQLYEFFDKAVIHKKDGVVPFKPNSSKINQTIAALKCLVLEDDSHDPPFDRRGSAVSREPLVFRNGALDVATRKLSPSDPNLFAINCLPFDYDRSAPKPKQWLRFLKQLWPGMSGRQARITLQKICGLLLTTDTRYHKIFMLIGPKRSGKGTIGRVITALCGKDNVVNPKMHSLTGEFGLWPLIDKQVAIISDARIGQRANPHAVVEHLLSISGEDNQTINRKRMSFWSGKLAIRFVILTNELPKLPDASGAFVSRFVVLVMPNCFYDRVDLHLTDKLLAELPGIFNWALAGLDRLRKKPYFIMPKASKRMIRQFEALSSPVTSFVEEWCVIDADAQISTRELFDAYCFWCEQNGMKPTSQPWFGRDLLAAFMQIRKRGQLNRRYCGIDLSDHGRKQYEGFDHARRRGV